MTAPSLASPSRPAPELRRPGAPLPPGPRGALLQTLRYLRDPYAYYRWAVSRYGRLFTLPVTNGNLLVTGTPEGVEELFQARTGNFVVEFGAEAVRPVVGPGSLLLLAGDRHRKERKRLSPSFHGSRMRSAYSDVARDATLERIAGWKPGESITVHEEAQRITLDVILRAVFGVEAPEQVEAFGIQVGRTMDSVPPLPIFVKAFQRRFGGFGPWARFCREMDSVNDLIYSWIRSRRRELERNHVAPGPGADILSLMLSAEDEDGGRLSDSDVRDQLLTIIAAGHETTTTTAAWSLYELHRKPAELARVQRAIASLGPEPAAAELAALPELTAAINETLRLHPVLLEAMRTVKEPMLFQGIEVPSGWTLAAAMPLVHLDPAVHPEPLEFRPQRFLDHRFPLCEFFPFGGGHRRCLGAAFAMNELAVVLGTILSRFELRLALDRPLRNVRRNATIAPELGVPMIVTSRR